MFCGGGCLAGFAGFTGGSGVRGKGTVPGSPFYKVADLRPAALLKGRLWRGCFSRGFSEISGGAFSTEHLRKTASVFYSNVLKIDLAILNSY